MTAALAGRNAQGLRVNDIGALHRIVLFLDRRLKVQIRGRARRLDLGGAFLGVVAALALLLSGLLGLFRPVQARMLAGLVAFRSAPLLAQLPRTALGRLLDESDGKYRTQDIVLVRMDGATRREILLYGSESATQAQIIRLLTRYGARRIVLPTPLLNPAWQETAEITLDVPRADAAAVARNVRDLPELIQAVRKTGNVILSVPDIHAAMRGQSFTSRFTPRSDASVPLLHKLADAAQGVGYAELDDLNIRLLPAIRLRWNGLYLREGEPEEIPPLPFVLFAAEHNARLPVSCTHGSAEPFSLIHESLPVTDPGSILVSYFAGEPNRAFPTLDYQAALNGRADSPLPVLRSMSDGPFILGEPPDRQEVTRPPRRNPDGSTLVRWVPTQALFKDKIVFLEGVNPHLRQTPIGSLSEPELLAHATTTLLSGSIVHRLWTKPLQQVLLTTLLLAALIGHLSLRRTPFQAGLVSAVVAFVFIVVCLLSFIFLQIWIDMLMPLLAGLAAYLLVVQYTFAVDKWEVSRNRELLERYLDRDSVNKLLETGYVMELGGVRKPICVLFADIRGFTGYANDNPPEEVVQTINKYLTAMSEQVFRNDGLLDKFLGDGLLALFGITETRPDDALRAVRAAVGMQEEVARISADLVREGRQPLRLGIGLHYGEAVVGLMGSERCPDLTAIGRTVVICHRLQSTAEGGEIVLTEDIYAQLGDAAEVEMRPPVQVKGFAEPVRSYRLLSLRPPV